MEYSRLLTLTGMLTQNLNHSPATSEGVLIPLEVPACVIEHSSKFVALEFIRGEYSRAVGFARKTLSIYFLTKRIRDSSPPFATANSFQSGTEIGSHPGQVSLTRPRRLSLFGGTTERTSLMGLPPFWVKSSAGLYDESHCWRALRPSPSTLASGIGT